MRMAVLSRLLASQCDTRRTTIQEFTGAAVFDLWLHRNLPHSQTHPPKDEVYLTDALEIAAATLPVRWFRRCQ